MGLEKLYSSIKKLVREGVDHERERLASPEIYGMILE